MRGAAFTLLMVAALSLSLMLWWVLDLGRMDWAACLFAVVCYLTYITVGLLTGRYPRN